MTVCPPAPERVGDDASRADPDGYAPHPIDADEARNGVEWRQFVTRLGVVSARVSPERTSDTATVLLHGAAGSWSTWTPLLAEARLAAGRTGGGPGPSDLVLIDLPGWGHSVLPGAPPARPRDTALVEVYSCAVVEVLHSLGYRAWHVIGHSMGGFLALDLAAREREATLSVGLVSATTGSVAEAVRHPVRGLLTRPAFVGLLAVMLLFRTHGDAASALLRALDRVGLLRAVVSTLFARGRAVPRSVREALAREVRPDGFVLAARLLALTDLEQSLAGIRCPVISVRGDHDVFVTAGDDERLALLLPAFGSTVLPSVGHFAQIEAPAAVLALFAGAFSPRS
ncbi:MAG: alpha/beta hydrolase [Herbiconiux sp.]|nr:alpha/beta hydrolase [Herbiconiux sp.]